MACIAYLNSSQTLNHIHVPLFKQTGWAKAEIGMWENYEYKLSFLLRSRALGLSQNNATARAAARIVEAVQLLWRTPSIVKEQRR